MALDFPNSPNPNQIFIGPNGVSWVYDGTKWRAGASTVASVTVNAGRNFVDNPLFNIAQRGATPVTTTGSYSMDRWRLLFLNGTNQLQQSALGDAERAAIGDEAAQNSLQMFATGSATAGSYCLVEHAIENVRRLGGKNVTISFWAFALAGPTRLGISMDQRFGTGGSPSTSVFGNGISLLLPNSTWGRYSISLGLPSTAGKTLGTSGNSSTALNFWFSADAGTYGARSGGIGVQNATISLWGVQVEEGITATALEKPGPQQELARCQRYYQVGNAILNCYSAAGNGFGYYLPLPVTMRATPTAAVVSSAGSANCTGITATGVNAGVVQVAAGSTTATAQALLTAAFTATADL